MIRHPGPLAVLLALAALSQGQEPPRPRAGLSAAQTKEAVKIAAPSLTDLRQKAPDAAKPDADPREYVVSVERLDAKPKGNAPATASNKAVVTTYRYLDDTTIYSTVDLDTGRTVDVATARHMQTPLSDGEFEAAKKLAVEKSDEVKGLYERFGKRVDVYAQFSQYTPEGDDRIHRVVLILYRVDKRDLSAPRPMVDLTTRQVTVARPEAEADDAEKKAAKPGNPRP